MRLFVGIYPDENLKAYLRDVISDMQTFKNYLKFTPPEQIHLTLKFLGNDISEDTYAEYANQLEKNLTGFQKFDITPSELSFGFKYQIRPKVLLMTVEPNEQLNELTQIATDAAKIIPQTDIITKKEHKKLVHHITIGRPKRIPSKSEGKRIREFLNTIKMFEGSFTADNVHLIQSILTAQGPIYKVLREYKLQ